MVTLEEGKMLKSADGESLEFVNTLEDNPTITVPVKRRPLLFQYSRPKRCRRWKAPRKQP